MTSQQILEKAIQKAIDGGWKYKEWMFEYSYPNFEQTSTGRIIVAKTPKSKAHFMTITELIFNHDFAKALWGEDRYGKSLPSDLNIHLIQRVMYAPAWQIHLQQMVIADDPIKYLGENL